jgi:hypothetical protein
MGLRDRITESMKAALRAGDKKRLSVLRMVLSELKVADASGKEVDELAVVKAYAKKLRKTADEYSALNLTERAREALGEAVVVEEFLPKQMDTPEIEKLIGELIEKDNLGPDDVGRLMKTFMSEHGASADGRLVQQIARQKLAQRREL